MLAVGLQSLIPAEGAESATPTAMAALDLATTKERATEQSLFKAKQQQKTLPNKVLSW